MQAMIFTSYVLILFLKSRIIQRVIDQPLSLDYLAYSFQDMFILSILMVCTYKFLNKFRVICLPVLFIIIFNILYISKMGYPITKSLLNHVGDYLFIQTSIVSPSIFRNVILLMVITLILSVVFFAFNISKVKKIFPTKFFLILNIIVFSISALSYFYTHPKIDGRYSNNIFISFFSSPASIEKMLSAEHFEGLVYKKWENDLSRTNAVLNKYNVVLIISETFTDQINSNENVSEIFPNFEKLKEDSLNFSEHYTSWPFSSKSIYSIFCGNYPSPTSVIEMRVGGSHVCNSWVTDLVENSKYNNFTAYTGNFAYDNMGIFLERIGFSNQYDRVELNKNNKFVENALSIDDLSMVHKFDQWLEKNSQRPFISTFITMNSHFPFWTPQKAFEKFGDPYVNSMHYQDHFIGKMIELLQNKNIWDKTIFIVTGDHGKRVDQKQTSILSKSMFKIPLLVKIPKAAGSSYNHITNHAQIGGTISKIIKGTSYGIKGLNLLEKRDHLIFYETDQLFFSILSDNQSSVLTPEGKIYKSSGKWPSYQDKECDIRECRSEYLKFFGFLSNLRDYYNL